MELNSDYLTNEMYDHFIGNPNGLRKLVLGVVFGSLIALITLLCIFASINKEEAEISRKNTVKEVNISDIENNY